MPKLASIIHTEKSEHQVVGNEIQRFYQFITIREREKYQGDAINKNGIGLEKNYKRINESRAVTAAVSDML